MKDNPTVLRVQIDGWSKYQHGYIRVIISYLTAEWKRATLALALPYDDHHTTKNLAEPLKTELDKWRLLGKFQFLTSDSAANMMAMELHLGKIEHVICLNHVLQLVGKSFRPCRRTEGRRGIPAFKFVGSLLQPMVFKRKF